MDQKRLRTTGLIHAQHAEPFNLTHKAPNKVHSASFLIGTPFECQKHTSSGP